MPSIKQEGLCSLKFVRAEPRGVYRKSVLMGCRGETKYPTIHLRLNGGKKAFIFKIRDRKCLLCLRADRVSHPDRALLSGLFYMYVQEQPGLIRRTMLWTFLTADRGPAGGAHLWGPVCVCYCWERQGLASEVIRAAACLSLSLQPENTLLFRTTLTAQLPLPRRLSSPILSSLLFSETLTGFK